MTEEPPKQYVHSVKVPQKFKTAAKFISNAIKQGISLKTQIYNQKHERSRALVYTSLRKIVEHKSVLDDIIAKSQILITENRMDPYLCLVLTAELLFGNGLSDQSKPSQCILSHRDKLFDLLEEHKGVITEMEKQKETRPTPRYVRVNTNLMSRAEAIEEFTNDGWEPITDEFKTYDDFLVAVDGLGIAQYLSDIHVQNLFVFPWSSKQYWAKHYLVKESKIVLQDKASCLSSFFLDPPRGSVVLDMCAAPGMKTTHLAAIMKNRGTIFAVEYNALRYETLLEFAAKSKSSIIKPINADVMTVNSDTIKSKIEYILLDPPCSGSGMDNRLSLLNESAERKKTKNDRLFQLGGLQIRMLVHAMKEFPYAKRIVYSTCSTSDLENEHVIQRAFEICPDQNWELVKPIEFAEKWKNFGSSKYKHIGKKCLYSVPDVDRTIGFFVAILERNMGDKPAYFKAEKLAPHILNSLAIVPPHHNDKNQVNYNDVNHSYDVLKQKKENPFSRFGSQPENRNETVMVETDQPNTDNNGPVENLISNETDHVDDLPQKRSKKKMEKSEKLDDTLIDEKNTKESRKRSKLTEPVEESSQEMEIFESGKKRKKIKAELHDGTSIETCILDLTSTKEKRKKSKHKDSIDEPQSEPETLRKDKVDKKKKKTDELNDSDVEFVIETKIKKKKSKHKESNELAPTKLELSSPSQKDKKKKKKDKRDKRKNEPTDVITIEDSIIEIPDETNIREKRKKKKSKEDSIEIVDCNDNATNDVSLKQKKKKRKHEDLDKEIETPNSAQSDGHKKKKNKSKSAVEIDS